MTRNPKGQFTTGTSLSDEMHRLLDSYIASLKEQKDSKQSTLDTRRREVRYWLDFAHKNGIDPLDADEQDVRAYIQSTSDKVDTTRSSYYASVSSFYSIAQNDQLYDAFETVNHHPCEHINLANDYNIYNSSQYQRVQKLQTETDGIITIPEEDVKKMISSVPATGHTREMHNTLIRTCYYTACRADELSRMKVDNINWDDCSINIRSAKLNQKEHPDLIRRDVMFPQKFSYQLKKWVKNVRPSYSSHSADSPYLFLSHQSEQLNPSSITTIVKEAAQEAGVQQPLRPANPEPNEEVKEWLVTPHRLRRSAISNWVNNCDAIDVHQARRLAGHAQLSQTMEYVEEDKEQLKTDYQASY